MLYKGLPKCLHVRNSAIHGQGLFAREFIPKNTLLGVSHIILNGSNHRFDDNMYLPTGEVCIRTPLGAYYNHSEKPNCEKSLLSKNPKIFQLQTINDIEEGEELTCFYTFYVIKKEDRK